MDPRIEQVLLAQAAQEAEQGPRLSDMVALGAGVVVLLWALLQELSLTCLVKGLVIYEEPTIL